MCKMGVAYQTLAYVIEGKISILVLNLYNTLLGIVLSNCHLTLSQYKTRNAISSIVKNGE